LFIKNFPKDMKDQDMSTFLQRFGSLKSFFLPKEAGTNPPLNKGYCFCEYQSDPETENALRKLNGF